MVRDICELVVLLKGTRKLIIPNVADGIEPSIQHGGQRPCKVKNHSKFASVLSILALARYLIAEPRERDHD
jgi:hypothetical protein